MENKEYKSAEQKLWEYYKNEFRLIPSLVPPFIKSAYGTIATPLRIPTFIRKLKNKQTLLQRTKPGLGHALGIAGGSYFLYDEIIKPSIESAQAGDYLPLTVITALNLLSGAWEIRPSRKSKKIKSRNICGGT